MATIDVQPASESAGEGADSLPPDDIYVARTAMCLLQLPGRKEPLDIGAEATAFSSEIEVALRDKLGADSRVVEIVPAGAYLAHNARTFSVPEVSPDADAISDLVRRRFAFRLSQPIVFRLRVPMKNQWKYRGLDDIPSEEYLVHWSGMVLVVQWRQGSRRATGSGGHVALEVVKQAVAAAGYEARIEACSPGCLHQFVHADFVTFADETSRPDVLSTGGRTPVGRSLLTPFAFEADDLIVLGQVSDLVTGVLEYYALAKTRADVVLSAAGRVQSDSATLLSIAYAQASRRRLPQPGAVVDLWAMRGLRLEVRSLIASQWLGLALVEQHRRMWNEVHAVFMQRADEASLEAFAQEFDDAEDLVDDVDLTLVRASLTEVSARMEGRNMIAATAGGAIVGVAGTSLGYFIG